MFFFLFSTPRDETKNPNSQILNNKKTFFQNSLGDLGIGGLGISAGKIQLYVGGAGFHPEHAMPVILDAGTNRESLLQDPSYLGVREQRLGDEEHMKAVVEFCDAVKERFPDALVQFEDFQTDRAFAILEKCRDRLVRREEKGRGRREKRRKSYFNFFFFQLFSFSVFFFSFCFFFFFPSPLFSHPFFPFSQLSKPKPLPAVLQRRHPGDRSGSLRRLPQRRPRAGDSAGGGTRRLLRRGFLCRRGRGDDRRGRRRRRQGQDHDRAGPRGHLHGRFERPDHQHARGRPAFS